MDGLHDDAAEPNIHNEGQQQGDANEIWNDDALMQAYENAVSGFKSRTDSLDRPSRAHRCALFPPVAGLYILLALCCDDNPMLLTWTDHVPRPVTRRRPLSKRASAALTGRISRTLRRPRQHTGHIMPTREHTSATLLPILLP